MKPLSLLSIVSLLYPLLYLYLFCVCCMPRTARKIKREIKSIKLTLKILNRPENLDLEVIRKLEELLESLKEELNE